MTDQTPRDDLPWLKQVWRALKRPYSTENIVRELGDYAQWWATVFVIVVLSNGYVLTTFMYAGAILSARCVGRFIGAAIHILRTERCHKVETVDGSLQ